MGKIMAKSNLKVKKQSADLRVVDKSTVKTTAYSDINLEKL